MAAYFNGTLFRRNLARFWPITAACLLVSFFVFVAPMLGNNGYYSTVDYIGRSYRDIFTPLSGFCAAFVPVSTIFAALAVFGYLHNNRAAGFISALPISRKGLYITDYVSGLALTLAPTLVMGVIYGLTLVGEPVSFSMYLAWLAIIIAAHLLFFSIAVFCAFLTGNPFMQVFLYTLLNFLYPLFYLIVVAIAELLVYGFNGSIPFFSVLSPPVAMMSTLRNQYISGSAGMALLIWACYLVFAAGVVIAGYALYKRRRIEAAGDVLVHKALRPVFKYVLAFIAGALLGALLLGITGGFNNTKPALAVGLAVSTAFFGALMCLFIEMLIQKRLRVLKSVYRGALIYMAAVAALAILIRADVTGYEHRVPDASQVEAVSFSRYSSMDEILLNGDMWTSGRYLNGRGWQLSDTYVTRQIELGLPVSSDVTNEIKWRCPEYFESPEGIEAAIALHGAIVSEKAMLESNHTGGPWFVFTYKLKDGGVMTRSYYLPFSETDAPDSVSAALALYNQPEAVIKRNRFLVLPESEILRVAKYKVSGIYETPNLYSFPVLTEYKDGVVYYGDPEIYYGDRSAASLPVEIEGGDIARLLEAMRRDAEAGTLGRVTWRDITDEYSETERDTQVSIVLCYRADDLLPSAFVPDEMYGENNTVLRGFITKSDVGNNCVNTLEFLDTLPQLD